MNLKVLASLTLVLFGTSDGKQPFVPKAVATKQALSIRGGAGPLDPALTAKVFLGSCTAQGVYDYLAPNKSLGVYGVTADDVSTLLTGVGGGLLLMMIITAYGSLFTNMSTLEAIGLAQIPITVNNLRTILNGDSKANGLSMSGQWIKLAITSFTAHACLSGADYATVAVRTLAVVIGLTTIQCRFAPNAALKNLGLDETKRSSIAIFATKILGHHGIVAAILIGALVSNVDAYKALGYAQIPGLLSFLLFIHTGDFNKLGFEAAKAYPWIAAVAVLVLTLSF